MEHLQSEEPFSSDPYFNRSTGNKPNMYPTIYLAHMPKSANYLGYFWKISHHSFSSILGPDLPVALTHLAIVSFEDTVITVAGDGDGDGNVIGGFHQLKCDEEFSCQWTTMAQKLKQGRYWPVAIKIPDELANCIDSEK